MAFVSRSILGTGTFHNGRDAPYQGVDGQSASEVGMRRKGLFGVLDGKYLQEREQRIGDQTGSRLSHVVKINGKLVGAGMPYLHNGKVYYTNNASEVDLVDGAGFAVMHKKQEAIRERVARYAEIFADGDDAAIMLLGITHAQYEKLCAPGNETTSLNAQAGVHIFQRGLTWPSDIATVACHARRLEYATKQSRGAMAAKIRFMLAHASLPIIDDSGMSLKAIADSTDHPDGAMGDDVRAIDRYTRARPRIMEYEPAGLAGDIASGPSPPPG